MTEINDKQHTLNKYKQCMEELKRRSEAIELLVSGKFTTPFEYTNMEFCALQLRKMLELIALGNLVANKEEYKKHRENFEKDWNAKRIIEDIEKFNPNFYPKPIVTKINNIADLADPERELFEKFQSGNKKEDLCQWVDKKGIYLTKKLFICAYDLSSMCLHAENPFNMKKIQVKEKMHSFKVYVNLIIILLSQHNIQLCNGDILNCIMEAKIKGNPDKKIGVSVTYFERLNKQ